MKKTLFLFSLITILFAMNTLAQKPRASQKSSLSQTVGNTEVSIIYHRPNVKGRTIWGDLVPYGKVWRTGANNATVFEVSGDVRVNGQKLSKGKYSLYSIPGEKEWTIIFNKTWDQWGTRYDEAQDALRVKTKPAEGEFRETMMFSIENVSGYKANVVIAWDKLRIPFEVDTSSVAAEDSKAKAR